MTLLMTVSKKLTSNVSFTYVISKLIMSKVFIGIIIVSQCLYRHLLALAFSKPALYSCKLTLRVTLLL